MALHLDFYKLLMGTIMYYILHRDLLCAGRKYRILRLCVLRLFSAGRKHSMLRLIAINIMAYVIKVLTLPLISVISPPLCHPGYTPPPIPTPTESSIVVFYAFSSTKLVDYDFAISTTTITPQFCKLDKVIFIIHSSAKQI